MSHVFDGAVVSQSHLERIGILTWSAEAALAPKKVGVEFEVYSSGSSFWVSLPLCTPTQRVFMTPSGHSSEH